MRDPKLIFEKHTDGRRQTAFPNEDKTKGAASYIPEKYLREAPPEIPEIGELNLIRHYTALSKRNTGVTDVFYPLGSCTMKYNPVVNDFISAMPNFANSHPYQPPSTTQGILETLYETERSLADISGLDSISLHPAAGAHGELTALMVIRKYLETQKMDDRRIMLIPDSAHGTNPASCTLAGLKAKKIKSCKKTGLIDIEDLKKNLSDKVAGIMVTNPNTLGLFEKDIDQIVSLVHQAGGQVYMDGANLNAILGITRPGDFGVDVMHFNLHKTFATPHGCGGPGAGPIGVAKHLAPHLPVPRVIKDGDVYKVSDDLPLTIGQTRAFSSNAIVVLRAYAYILSLGKEGVKRVAENAVLNANYLRVKVGEKYHVPYNQLCMHEFIATPKNLGKTKTLDIAKRLIDKGVHPPTVYFPLIVPEAIMVEPTETESKETLDRFVTVMHEIAEEAINKPELLKDAPHHAFSKRLDEVKAVKEPILRWTPDM